MEMNDDSSFAVYDVLIEILLLLPPKSLGLCKCVCKKWYNLIQNPNFITNYLHHSNSHNRLFVIHSQKRSTDEDISFTLFLDESLSVQQNIDNPLISNGLLYSGIERILGPVNGLYCLHYYYETDDEDYIALWNPFTSEFRELHYPSIELPSHIKYSPQSCLYYFGFGSTDDDIKLVCISSFRCFNKDKYARFDSVISLYSLTHDSWKQIEYDTNLPSINSESIHETGSSTFLNEAYYWRVGDDHVILFDMRDEVFREVQLPAKNLLCNGDNSEKTLELGQILVRNNAIVLFVNQISRVSEEIECVNIWETKEEGCWNKIFSFAPHFYHYRPSGFWKDDEIIFQEDDVNLYNIRCNESRNLGIEAGFVNVLDYKESLTSVQGGRGRAGSLYPRTGKPEQTGTIRFGSVFLVL